MNSPIVGKVYKGQTVVIFGTWNDWYVIEADGITGYANRNYITL